MKLILVRHGESEGNIKPGFISGRRDTATLTLKGKSQIIRTAWDLQKVGIDTVYTSPVARAQETAQLLNNYLHVPQHTADWLTELDHGILEGHYWWEVIHKIPPSWRHKREDFHTPYPEGESMEMLMKRVWDGLHKLITESKHDTTILLVSHQAVITAIRFCLEQGDPKVYISTKEKIKEFMKYMHGVTIPNGAYIQAELAGQKMHKIKETTTFDEVPTTHESVTFYARSMCNLKDTAQILPVEDTASTNVVYKIANGEPHILKLLHGKDAKANVRQAKLYAYLNTHDLPVSRIQLFDNSRVFFADDVFVQDYVEGDVMKVCVTDHAKALRPLLDDIFQTVGRIHATSAHEVSEFWNPPGTAEFSSWKPFMIMNINYTIHILLEEDIPGVAKKRIIALLEDLKAYVASSAYTVSPIHGDLASGNIIVHHTGGACRLRRIIDFEWARMGDPLWDLAYFWGWLERDNPSVARVWQKLLERARPKSMARINEYRVLFHAWTVRDMAEYPGNTIRIRRGRRSRDLLIGTE